MVKETLRVTKSPKPVKVNLQLASQRLSRLTSTVTIGAINRDIDWAKQNKMLRDLRWKQRGQPEKTVWWSI